MVGIVSAGKKPASHGPRECRYVEFTRVYLDVCCLGRPIDDQSQESIRAEPEWRLEAEYLLALASGDVVLIRATERVGETVEVVERFGVLDYMGHLG
jgi:hypothetical protein